ncbi:MAG: hypothetical protein Q8922_12425 [Bacteroidota bacterium]|nr:hypothetical protein [Bacteroidota bacterium]MDP4232202.1 hypothetical protein [Bacteroidota bacterium]MDP4243617.1 hypothetical protein [Bacteroidota bacterium]MDP4288730.1 hypothetical protein [Bacteroidota bacterium]
MASNSNEPYSMDSARKYQIVELLLKYGAEPNYALGQCRDSAIAELLIRNGAKVDEEYGRELKSTLTEELEYLANPAGSLRGKLVKGTGHTVLFEVSSDWPGWSGGSRGSPWSFDAATSDSITGRRLGFMTVLLTHGAKPNANNASMLINLIRNISARWENDEASYQGDTIHLLCLNLVKILVEAGAEVNISYHDVTPLLAAVESHWPAAVDY